MFVQGSGLNRPIFAQFFSGGLGQWAAPTNTITTGTFHHIAVTYDRTSPDNDPVMYIDGVKQTVSETTPSGTANSDAGDNLLIGSRPTDRFFDGKIDDVAIWNRILSEAEIEDIYGTSVPLKQP